MNWLIQLHLTQPLIVAPHPYSLRLMALTLVH